MGDFLYTVRPSLDHRPCFSWVAPKNGLQEMTGSKSNLGDWLGAPETKKCGSNGAANACCSTTAPALEMLPREDALQSVRAVLSFHHKTLDESFKNEQLAKVVKKVFT